MSRESQKQNALFLLLGAGLSAMVSIIIFLVFLKPDEQPSYDKQLIETRIKTLEQENTALKEDVSAELIKSTKYLIKIDSLEARKPNVQIKYVKIYENIDHFSALSVVSELDSIFTTNR